MIARAALAANMILVSFVAPARIRRYFALDSLVGMGGIVVLALAMRNLDNAFELSRVMLWYMLAQYIPVVSRLAWTIRLARAFRALPPPSIRRVELRQWRAVDFVSPVAIGLGLFASVLACVCAGIAYMQPSVSIWLVLFSGIVNGWILFRMLYVLIMPVTFGRADPYMSQGDVFEARRTRFRVLFVGGACLGAYFSFVLLYVAGLVRFDVAYLAVGVSVLCQALFLAAASRMFRALESRDFSVYRDDTGIQPACAP
jgi:hypothetical protein